MTRRNAAAAVALALAAICATAAPAAFAQPTASEVSVQLHEPFHSSCFVTGVFLCGTGEAAGYGPVTETIQFGAACGGSCDLRTITFSDDSTLVLQETASDCSSSGQSYKAPPQPSKCVLAEAVDGDHSTGTFAGTTGTLSGTVDIGGGTATIHLAGQITPA